MANLTSVLKDLAQERDRLAVQPERFNHALSVLIGTSNHRAKITISAAGRARIAAAQRARWAKSKGHKFVSLAARRTHDVTSRPQEDCCGAESMVGKAAEGTPEGLVSLAVEARWLRNG